MVQGIHMAVLTGLAAFAAVFLAVGGTLYVGGRLLGLSTVSDVGEGIAVWAPVPVVGYAVVAGAHATATGTLTPDVWMVWYLLGIVLALVSLSMATMDSRPWHLLPERVTERLPVPND